MLLAGLLAVGCSHPERGRQLYLLSCASCHQPDGRGMEGVGPPLAGSSWVTGPPERLILISLHGVRGPIEVGGASYNLEMPPMAFFADDDMAALLTHARRAWGNSAGPVSTEDVRRVREAARDRGDSWTVEELLERR